MGDPLRSASRAGPCRGGTRLTTVAAITLGVCLLGIVLALVAGVRRGVAVTGLLLLFAGAALRQALLLHRGDLPAFEPGAASAGELGLLLAVLGGIVALYTLRRTTGERDRAEDLHWDSMEVVRAMSELAARPGAALEKKLGSVLELGAARFDLDVGIVWRDDDGDPTGRSSAGSSSRDLGTVVALRAPERNEDADALVETLLPRLRDVAKSTRPVLLVDTESGLQELFGASLCVDGEGRGALAFAGPARARRITATDKDLCALMAQWLSIELERRTQPRSADLESPAPRAPEPDLPRAGLPRRNLDLNDAVRRLEPRLRRRVGADATLELGLGTHLPPARSGRLPLASLVESLVLAAAELSPAGRIRVETGRTGEADGAGDLKLCVSVTGGDVEAGAFDRLFAQPQGAPSPSSAGSGAAPAAGAEGPIALYVLERLLRREGGDLSVAVEPRRRAAITAYLPAAGVRSRSRGAAPAARSSPQSSR